MVVRRVDVEQVVAVRIDDPDVEEPIRGYPRQRPVDESGIRAVEDGGRREHECERDETRQHRDAPPCRGGWSGRLPRHPV